MSASPVPVDLWAPPSNTFDFRSLFGVAGAVAVVDVVEVRGLCEAEVLGVLRLGGGLRRPPGQ